MAAIDGNNERWLKSPGWVKAWAFLMPLSVFGGYWWECRDRVVDWPRSRKVDAVDSLK